MQIISNVALISINETLLFQIISFLIFLFIFNRIILRPLRRAMHERQIYIDNTQKVIVDTESKFEALTAQIQEQEKAVRNEALEQTEKLAAAAARQADEIMKSTREEINALRAEAQKEVDARISAARKHVRKEAEDLVKHIIATVLYRSLPS